MISSSFVVKAATVDPLPALTFDGAVATADANGILSVDGLNLVVGDIFLVKDQVLKAQNGIFSVVDAGTLGSPFIIERYPQSLGLKLGNIIYIKEGDINTSRLFVVTSIIKMVGSDDTCVEFAMSTLVISKITEASAGEGVNFCLDMTGITADTNGIQINGIRVLRDRLSAIGDFPVPAAVNNPAILNDAVTKTDYELLRVAVNTLYQRLSADLGNGHGLFN